MHEDKKLNKEKNEEKSILFLTLLFLTLRFLTLLFFTLRFLVVVYLCNNDETLEIF
jgi:hypothetical protein